MKKFIIKIVNFMSRFIKKDNKLITLLFQGYSGSNISPIIERIRNNELGNFNVKIIRIDKENAKTQSKSLIVKIINRYSLLKDIYLSRMVITSHGYFRLRHDCIMINLWHGMPFKGMSLMNKSKTDTIGFIKDDYFISTSEFNNTVMNSCIGLEIDKYRITGYPRNDYFFNQDGPANLEKLIGRKITQKVLLYMPTYKEIKDNDIRITNFFGFDKFEFDEFNSFLKKNKYLFIIKLHPNEEKRFHEIYSKFLSDNIFMLDGKILEENKMDLYKIINAIDLLITDYSSIYFDYLLLNRPIVFNPFDLNEYRKSRGLLFEPYDFWTPGPKCVDQDNLQKEIVKSLNERHYYEKQREIIKNIIHKYQDGNSTDRVMKLIKNALKN